MCQVAGWIKAEKSTRTQHSVVPGQHFPDRKDHSGLFWSRDSLRICTCPITPGNNNDLLERFSLHRSDNNYNHIDLLVKGLAIRAVRIHASILGHPWP